MISTPKGFYNASASQALVQPLRGKGKVGCDVTPGCARKASRSWAVEYNPFGVKAGQGAALPRVRSQSLATLGCGIQPLRGKTQDVRSLPLYPEGVVFHSPG